MIKCNRFVTVRFSQRLNLLDKVERSWELRAPRGDRNKFRSTLRWTRVSRATRQTWTRVNVSENCYNLVRIGELDLLQYVC